jgi:predicted dehydrogenase
MHTIEVEDTVVAILEFTSGAIGTLEAATSVYPGYPRTLEVSGSEGTIILENDRITSASLRTPLPEQTGEQAMLPDERSVSPAISDASGHRKLIEDFIQKIESREPPVCDGLQGRRSVDVVQAIYESSRTGRPVRLAVSG